MTDVAGLEIQIKQTGAVRATSDLSRLEKQSRKTETATQRMERSFLSLKRVAVGAFAAIAAQSIIAFQAIKVGASFEQEMAKVRGITNATALEFKALTGIAKELGATTEWSATQAAQGLEFLGMAGFSAAKSIKALPGVLDLATAGAIDLGRAADIVSNALTAMRLPVESLSRVNDVFVKTITSSNTNMEMMAESFKYSAPLAASYGMEIETLAGLIGMLGNAGIQGSMAGTQLAFGFQNVAKVFDKYGESLTRLDGTTKDYIDALRLLEERGASTNEVMKIFGVRAGRAALALMGQGVPALEAYIKEIENAEGATSKLAAIMRDTLTGDIKTLKSTLEDVSISMFATWGTDLRTLVQTTTQIIRENKDSLVEFFKGMASGALAAFKAIIKGIAKLREAFLGLISIVGIVQKSFAEITIKGLDLEVARIEQRIAVLQSEPSWREKTFGDAMGGVAREEALKKAMHDRTLLLQQIVNEREEIAGLTITQLDIEADLNKQLIDIDKIIGDIQEKLKAQAIIKDNISKLDKDANDEIKKLGNICGEASPKINEAYEKLKAFFAIHMLSDDSARQIEQLRQEYAKLEDQLVSLWTQGKITDEQLMEGMSQVVIAHENDLALMVDATDKTTDEIGELWTNAMDRVQSQVADVFYDAFRRELDDASDYFEAFCDTILRYFAEMAAQMTMYDLFGIGKGAGGSGWGSFLGGMLGGGGGTSFGGAYGSGNPNNPNFVGPLQQGMQGAQSAYSLYGAYGAYGQAGGGWGGVKAGAGSFFGGGGSGGFGSAGGLSFAAIAAIVYMLESFAAGQNVKRGYGRVEGTPYGYGEYQPAGPWGGDIFNEPLSTYGRGLVGWDEPTATSYQSLAMKEGDFGEWLKASMVAAFDPLGLVESALGSIGIDLGKIFGYSNKKRSYFGEIHGFGDYSPEAGWGISDWSHEWKDKRDGEKAFGEAGKGMAETAQGLMNALDSMFKDLLGTFDETKVNSFTTAMAELSAEMIPVTEATKGYQQLLEQGITEVPRMSFGYYISAEDEDEFKDDWRESWKRVTANIIDPIVEIGSDLLNQALDGSVTDATAWNYFTNDMRKYLRAGLTEGLEGLDIDWSAVTDQESFDKAFEQMGISAEQIASVVGYFEQVGTILDHITSVVEHEFSDATQSAISGFQTINAEFEQYALTLASLGIDLKKYTDLEKAHLMALRDESKAMSDAAISGEDLAEALKYMSEEMTEAGHTVEEIAAAMNATYSGILDSIEEIKQRAENYGKTALDLMYEKHPEWQGMSYEQWAGTNLADWSVEMLQEWRNLGDLLERQWEDLMDVLTNEEDQKIANSIQNATDASAFASQNLANAVDELIELGRLYRNATEAITGLKEDLLGSLMDPVTHLATIEQRLNEAVRGLYGNQETQLASLQSIPNLVEEFLRYSREMATSPQEYNEALAKAMAILNTAEALGVSRTHAFESIRPDEGYITLKPQDIWPYPDPGVVDRLIGMSEGGAVSGPSSGYTAPIEFHGTEHIVSGDQMSGVKEELKDIKVVLSHILIVDGEQKTVSKKTHKLLQKWDIDEGSLKVETV